MLISKCVGTGYGNTLVNLAIAGFHYLCKIG